MNKKIANMWVKALRSGKYKQGKHMLSYKDEEFCCLGVLCEVMGLKSEAVPRSYGRSYLGVTTYLPQQVAELAEIENQENFVAMNDVQGLSFDDIADFIERNWRVI